MDEEMDSVQKEKYEPTLSEIMKMSPAPNSGEKDED